MFVIDINYTASLDIINQHVDLHRKWLDAKFKEGILLCSGPKNPRTGGIIIALCNSREQVDNLIKEDPYYQNKVADYEITEFLLNKFHPEIKNLAN